MATYNIWKMTKDLMFAILLIVTLIKVDSTFAKPVSDYEKLNLRDVVAKPGFTNSLPPFMKSDSGDGFERMVSGSTGTLKGSDKISSGNIITPTESIKLTETLSPVSVSKFGSSKVTNINAIINEEADDLSTTLKPGDSLAVTPNSGSWTADSLVTSSESVSGGTESLVTSLKPDSGVLVSLVTDSKLGILPGGLEPGSGLSDSFTTTFLPVTTSLATTFQSDSETLQNFLTTIKPDNALTTFGPDSSEEKESLLTTLKPTFESLDKDSKTLPIKNGSSRKFSANESSHIVTIVSAIFFILNLQFK